MRRLVLVAAFATVLGSAAPSRGLPARHSPSDYPASSSDKGVTVAADVMDSDQVRSSFATDLSGYLVVEVALYPKSGTTLDISAMDFALYVDGRMMRPAEPRSIAGINQRKSRAQRDDIALYPTVGMTTGTWGTGVGVGVGVGRNGRPGPASTDHDRRTMETELDEKGLQEGDAAKPVAGYLYFPVGPAKKRSGKYELHYQANGV